MKKTYGDVSKEYVDLMIKTDEQLLGFYGSLSPQGLNSLGIITLDTNCTYHEPEPPTTPLDQISEHKKRYSRGDVLPFGLSPGTCIMIAFGIISLIVLVNLILGLCARKEHTTTARESP